MSAHPLVAREAGWPVAGDAVRVEGLHVEGYGVWRDLRLDLAPGLNVLHGPNEVGKSTLHAFVRHMLFGIPDGRFKENSHPPVHGGIHGGRLFLSRGRESLVARRVGPSKIEVVGADGAVLSPSVLESWLQGIDGPLYRNLFAFGVEELASFDSLSGDAIGARLFDVGLEGAGRSVSSWLEGLKKRKEVELKPRSGAIRERVRELEGHRREVERAILESHGYEKLLEREEALGVELAGIVQEERDHRVRLERAATLLSCWPLEWRRRKAEEVWLRQGPARPLPPLALERFDRAMAELERLSSERREIDTELARVGEAWSAAAPDPRLASVEEEVVKALAEVDLQVDRERRFSALEGTIREGEAALGERMKGAAGEGEAAAGPWSATGFRDRVAIDEAEAALTAVRAATARYEELSRRLFEVQMAGGFWTGGQAWALGAALLLLVSGIGLALGGSIPWGWASFAAGTIWSALLYRAIRITAMERRVALDRLKADRGEALAEIGRHARRLGLGDRPPGPVEIERVVAGLARARRTLEVAASLARARAEADALRREIACWEEKVDGLLSRVGQGGPGRAGLFVLAAALEEDRRRRSRRREWEASRRALEKRLERLAFEEDRQLGAIGALLEEAGVEDRGHLEEAHLAQVQRQEAEKTLEEVNGLLIQHLGTGEEAAATLEELRTGEKLAWERIVQACEERARALGQRRLHLHEEQALVRHERQSTEASSRIPDLAAEGTRLQGRLAASVERFRVASLVEHLLQSTLERFQAERQPRVLHHAARAFSVVTGGRYVGLRQPAGTRNIEAIDGRDRAIPGRDLSRGTRDQLYLCLRLGLIEAFAERGTRLPLLMDDVLVHFDPARADAMAELLSEVARRHQLLFFTCHPQNVERLLRVAPGAHRIDLEER